ncbi:MAG: hypothetical protein EPN21_18800 [Methylococcaceae bacterium]|nr:MAG: hypothetical protein EPN21_18800 [Methylococcaceae bacterium]
MKHTGQMLRWTRLLAMAGGLFLVGCMTINEAMLRKVSVFPEHRSVAVVEVRTGELRQQLNGEGQNKGAFSGSLVLDSVANSMMARWKSKNIIADYAFTSELKTTPDYTVTLSGVRREDSSIKGSIYSGLTLMLFPASAKLTYDLKLEFVNQHTQRRYLVKVKNAATTWTQLLLLPAAPFAWLGGKHMVEDMADYAYDELRLQGAFAGL